MLIPFFCESKQHTSKKAVKVVVVIPSYNNEQWYKKNLDSVVKQDYSHLEIIYVNDCSNDKTGELVDDYVRSNNLEHKVKVIHNAHRCGALSNLYSVIHTVADNKIIVCVDGDDELVTNQALNRIAREYQDDTIWLTYGQYYSYPSKIVGVCRPILEYIYTRNAFRSYKFVASHVRTFYAGLFKKIKKEDLLWRGNFYPMAWDLAIMLPMLEMASKKHFKFIPDILYKYNQANPINDYKVNCNFLLDLEKQIRAKKKYKPLSSLTFTK